MKLSLMMPPHPYSSGYVFRSPGGQFSYRVIGPCCRLFDREELPWPCCRLQWRSKEPSWRRIGRRFVADLAAKRSPSYWVEIVGPGYTSTPFIITLYTVKLSGVLQNWWYTKRFSSPEGSEGKPTASASPCEF